MTMRLWDAATGAHRQTLEGHGGLVRVRAVAFSPDGKTLEGHGDWATAVAEKPDGRHPTTNFGSIQVSFTSGPPDQHRDKHPTVHSLYVDNEWITVDGKKCLWLPNDYRSPEVAVHGNTIVLGRRSGGLTFLETKVL
ncbi:hypothetical protein HIM_11123 [Hirsutella minnesotensis 3608]|uniref:Uncharacterized protein n=1 Tax=Hirsutella minnesotensis 3608 TaxID=1043627 RepID=A0A0F7ZFP1_9HYPO|nr:hypothetical protein HIM_11123 [Hirsutella minnesotensis 3608]